MAKVERPVVARYPTGDDNDINVEMHATPLSHEFAFTVCTLLASDEKYQRLLSSFHTHGFTADNTQFIAVDNRSGNHFDGFSWIRRMLPECRGQHIIFCHDDIELVDDGFADLSRVLSQLTANDPRWAIAGNAGGIVGWTRDQRRFRQAIRITDPKLDNVTRGTLPAACESLDENFIIIRRDNAVSGSVDLTGFHFYGTDLCLQAELAGKTSYVIDFHLHHHSSGTKGAPYRQAKRRFEDKYRKIFPGRRVSTSTEILQF